MTWPFSMSRGPTSMRTGTPFISHSLNFQPALWSRSSTLVRMPAAVSSLYSSSAFSSTPGLCIAMGRITAWMGATRGGITRPRSSPWTMIIPPIMRVDTPQEVV